MSDKSQGNDTNTWSTSTGTGVASSACLGGLPMLFDAFSGNHSSSSSEDSDEKSK
jgi:hypothetical protein